MSRRLGSTALAVGCAVLVSTALAGTPAAQADGPEAADAAATQVAGTDVADAAALAPVSTDPADFTPQMTAPDGRNGNVGLVRQLTPCGSAMYAVGAFTEWKSPADGGRTFVRRNALSFNARTGKMTGFNPDTNGIVNSIAFNPSDCTTAYIGGQFSTVGGQPAKNIAAVDARTGALKTGFRRDASAEVNALVWTHNRLLVGGFFQSINGATRSRLASLNPGTGAPDSYLTLPLAGQYAGPGPTRAHNFTVNHRGTQMLVTGTFTTVGGAPRQQAFQLDLGATRATLNGWSAPDFTTTCQLGTSFYVQDATYSQDDRTIFAATTGGDIRGGGPHTGVCDAAVAYRNAPSAQPHLWVNYTGCDSMYSVVADASTVYVGGHQRWLNNERGCNSAGVGSVPRPGIGGVSPATGRATAWNPTKSRGIGADDLVLAYNGLWIASDNQFAVGMCGGEYHPGICFLPRT